MIITHETWWEIERIFLNEYNSLANEKIESFEINIGASNSLVKSIQNE